MVECDSGLPTMDYSIYRCLRLIRFLISDFGYLLRSYCWDICCLQWVTQYTGVWDIFSFFDIRLPIFVADNGLLNLQVLEIYLFFDIRLQIFVEILLRYLLPTMDYSIYRLNLHIRYTFQCQTSDMFWYRYLDMSSGKQLLSSRRPAGDCLKVTLNKKIGPLEKCKDLKGNPLHSLDNTTPSV